MPPLHPIPPPGQRFRWTRWEPYPNRKFDDPDDPPPNAEAYLLQMGNYEIARVQLLPGGEWEATVGTLWHRGLWRSRIVPEKAEAMERVERWADLAIEQLVKSRPTAYATLPISPKV